MRPSIDVYVRTLVVTCFPLSSQDEVSSAYIPSLSYKVTNIPNRTSIRERPLEADGTRFGDWEMDLIVGKEGKGAILTLTERSSNLLLMEKLPDGKKAASLPRVVNRLLFPYRGKGVRTITTDNGGEFACHELIEKKLRATVYFTDSYCSWQKGL